MIEINYTDYKHELEIKGHADSGEYGKDIICASVTTLACALLDILQEDEIESEIKFDDVGGYVYVHSHPSMSQSHDCNVMFRLITNALRDLADAYPNNIKFIVHKGEME